MKRGIAGLLAHPWSNFGKHYWVGLFNIHPLRRELIVQRGFSTEHNGLRIQKARGCQWSQCKALFGQLLHRVRPPQVARGCVALEAHHQVIFRTRLQNRGLIVFVEQPHVLRGIRQLPLKQ
ncbi:hypothetical protein D3C75_1057360 [compost metagenome]